MPGTCPLAGPHHFHTPASPRHGFAPAHANLPFWSAPLHQAGASLASVPHPDRVKAGVRRHAGWHMYCVACAKARQGPVNSGCNGAVWGHTDEGVCTCGFETSKPQCVDACFFEICLGSCDEKFHTSDVGNQRTEVCPHHQHIVTIKTIATSALYISTRPQKDPKNTQNSTPCKKPNPPAPTAALAAA